MSDLHGSIDRGTIRMRVVAVEVASYRGGPLGLKGVAQDYLGPVPADVVRVGLAGTEDMQATLVLHCPFNVSGPGFDDQRPPVIGEVLELSIKTLLDAERVGTV